MNAPCIDSDPARRWTGWIVDTATSPTAPDRLTMVVFPAASNGHKVVELVLECGAVLRVTVEEVDT